MKRHRALTSFYFFPQSAHNQIHLTHPNSNEDVQFKLLLIDYYSLGSMSPLLLASCLLLHCPSDPSHRG